MYSMLSLSLKNQRNDFSFTENRKTLRLQTASDQQFECSIDFSKKCEKGGYRKRENTDKRKSINQVRKRQIPVTTYIFL